MNYSNLVEGKVLYDGFIDLTQLKVTLVENQLVLEESIQAKVNQIWDVALKELAVFNGIFFRLKDFNFPYHMSVSKIDYKTIFGLLKLKKLIEIDLSQISIGATVRTNQNTFIVGVRQSGIIDLIGGGLQPESNLLTSGTQIIEHMLVELQEETGIRLNHEDIKCVGLIKDLSLSSNALFHFDIKLNMTQDLVQEIFKRDASTEFSELRFLSQVQYEEFLEQRGGYRHAILKLKELELS